MATVYNYPAFLPFVFTFILCFAACTGHAESSTVTNEQKQEIGNTWCIAKPSTDEIKLQDNIQYCCAQPGVDCSVIAPQGVCFYPNNPVSHASVAMNLYYRAAGKQTWNCFFNATALTVTVDPSFGSCIYPH